jgi:hypothetical protein
MRVRLVPVVLLLAAAAALAGAQAPPAPLKTPALTVHEWGTFTSIAGDEGQAVPWLPLGGRSDLPCFVERQGFKGNMSGTVRMETPVLYFYTPEEMKVNVRVGFRQGVITEWFPRARVDWADASRHEGAITWSDVTVSPRQAPTFPMESGPSHYYKARNTDATPLAAGSQVEKFLFYRGIGQFAPPIAAIPQADGKTVVWTPEGTPLGTVILFENRGGAMAYDVRDIAAGRATLDRPALDDATGIPARELVRFLVANGLYEREAQAMVDTWSDSWFEEGARLLYIVPRQVVDAILPLSIAPAPLDVARVFVGRMELITPVTRRAVRLALAVNDRITLEKYGRFLQPIGDRVLPEVSPLDRALMADRLRAVAAPWAVTANSCR